MSIEVKFEDLQNEVMRELKKAEKSVFIAVAWITFKLYSDTFKQLIDNGVSIDILCTNSSTNIQQNNLISELIDYGIKIRLCKMPRQTNHMHHKFVIIDNSTIINGSFNWSENAKKSFENITIIKDQPKLVSSFLQEFNKIKQLDKDAIKSLQSITKCSEKGCDGEISNLLVFQSTPMRMTYEIWGDIVKCCSVCGEESYTTIKSGIQDTFLNNFFSKYELYLDVEEELQFNRDVDLHLTGYSSEGFVIHGIGYIKDELLGKNRDYNTYTQIIWKNKFISDSVRDRYETNFGICYT